MSMHNWQSNIDKFKEDYLRDKEELKRHAEVKRDLENIHKMTCDLYIALANLRFHDPENMVLSEDFPHYSRGSELEKLINNSSEALSELAWYLYDGSEDKKGRPKEEPIEEGEWLPDKRLLMNLAEEWFRKGHEVTRICSTSARINKGAKSPYTKFGEFVKESVAGLDVSPQTLDKIAGKDRDFKELCAWSKRGRK